MSNNRFLVHALPLARVPYVFELFHRQSWMPLVTALENIKQLKLTDHARISSHWSDDGVHFWQQIPVRKGWPLEVIECECEFGWIGQTVDLLKLGELCAFSFVLLLYPLHFAVMYFGRVLMRPCLSCVANSIDLDKKVKH